MRALFALLLASPALVGCLSPEILGPAAIAGPDLPVVLPDLAFFDVPYQSGVGYHTLDELNARVEALAAANPTLARVETIGESREERPIVALVLTNRSLGGAKLAPFFDGGHHANEVEGIESTLFLAEYLLANYHTNATIRGMVDRLEIWIVPVVNPDGYVAQTRGNAMGVNLNRNYDVDWGHPLGGENVLLGAASGATGMPVQSVGGPFGENPGSAPWSEPEARAVRDALADLDGRLAFYLTHHTAVPSLLVPWAAFDPPFDVPATERAIFDEMVAWTREKTVFRAGTGGWGDTDTGIFYSASGTSLDWAYFRHKVPAATLEVAGCAENAVSDPRWGADNVECAATGPRDNAFWVQTTLHVQMKWLSNAAHLHGWASPVVEPLVPEGVPPEPPYT